MRLRHAFRRDPSDLVAFNTALASLLKRLKKDVGSCTVKQNYRGTGSQKARRQMWVRFDKGGVIDIWLDNGFAIFGGIVARREFDGPGFEKTHIPHGTRISYGDKTPEQVYGEIVSYLRPWVTLEGCNQHSDCREHREIGDGCAARDRRRRRSRVRSRVGSRVRVAARRRRSRR